MKILIATPTYPPYKDGVAQASHSQFDLLTRMGYDVHVATSIPPNEQSQNHSSNLNIHYFSIQGSAHFRDPFRGNIAAYKNLLLYGDWDIIIFHSYSWPLYLVTDLLDKIAASKILVSHGYGALVWTPVRKFPFGLGALVTSFAKSMEMLGVFRKINRLIFLSPQADLSTFYDHLLAKVIQHPGIRILPNGVPLHAPLSSVSGKGFLRNIGIEKKGPVFISIANYSLRKDQGFAARAFRQAAIKNSSLVFIGSKLNDFSRSFQKYDQTYHSDGAAGKIYWLENINRRDTLDALAASDVLILSARQEAQPIVLLEAMAYGIPWIARKAGCIAHLEGGLCVKSENEMAKAMVKLADSSSLRAQLGVQGRQSISANYSLDHYGKRLMAILHELCPIRVF